MLVLGHRASGDKMNVSIKVWGIFGGISVWGGMCAFPGEGSLQYKISTAIKHGCQPKHFS